MQIYSNPSWYTFKLFLKLLLGLYHNMQKHCETILSCWHDLGSKTFLLENTIMWIHKGGHHSVFSPNYSSLLVENLGLRTIEIGLSTFCKLRCLCIWIKRRNVHLIKISLDQSIKVGLLLELLYQYQRVLNHWNLIG